jgi:hypothetical protein
MPPMIAEEWEPAESATVGRLFGQARHRLSSRRSRSIEEPERHDAASLEQGQAGYLPWDNDAAGDESWPRRPGHSALEGELSAWDEPPAPSDNGKPIDVDPTDEIPVPPRPHS